MGLERAEYIILAHTIIALFLNSLDLYNFKAEHVIGETQEGDEEAGDVVVSDKGSEANLSSTNLLSSSSNMKDWIINYQKTASKTIQEKFKDPFKDRKNRAVERGERGGGGSNTTSPRVNQRKSMYEGTYMSTTSPRQPQRKSMHEGMLSPRGLMRLDADDDPDMIQMPYSKVKKVKSDPNKVSKPADDAPDVIQMPSSKLKKVKSDPVA